MREEEEQECYDGILPAGITQNALDTVIKDAALDMEWDCGANAGC